MSKGIREKIYWISLQIKSYECKHVWGVIHQRHQNVLIPFFYHWLVSTVLPFYMSLLLRRLLEHVNTISHRENEGKRRTPSMYAYHSFDIYIKIGCAN
jgi:hypothetical protein